MWIMGKKNVLSKICPFSFDYFIFYWDFLNWFDLQFVSFCFLSLLSPFKALVVCRWQKKREIGSVAVALLKLCEGVFAARLMERLSISQSLLFWSCLVSHNLLCYSNWYLYLAEVNDLIKQKLNNQRAHFFVSIACLRVMAPDVICEVHQLA